jgi:hypothetical protein
MQNLIKSSILIFIIGLGFGSCKKERNEQDELKPSITAPTIVLDTTTVSTTLDSISDFNGTMYFTGLSSASALETGDIICSAPTDVAPYGFLYKITEIRENGNHTVIETTDASLEDAIENTDFSTSINLDDKIIGIYDDEGNLLESENALSGQTKSSLKKSSVNISISKTFPEKGSGPGSITVSGNLTISNELQFEIRIKDHNLQYLRLAREIEGELKVTVSGEIKGNVQLFNKRIANIKLSPVTILVPAGPLAIPFTFTPEIPIYLKGDLNGSIEGSFEIGKNISAALGILYQNNELDKIFEMKSDSPSLDNAFKFVLSGDIKITVEPGCSFLLYNNKNVSLGASIGVYGKAALSMQIDDLALNSRYGLNPALKFSIGGESSVKAKLKIFALKLLDFTATGKIFEIDLFEQHVFPQFNPINMDNITPITADVSSIAKTPAVINGNGLFGLFPVSQYGICVSRNPLPNIATDSYNNLGALPETWTTFDAPIAASHLANLEPNTTYYVCPYFLNYYGDFYGEVQSFTTKNYRWYIDADIIIDGKTYHYGSDVFLDGFPNVEAGRARLPDFKWTEMTWNNPWRLTYGMDFRLIISGPSSDLGLDYESDWGNDVGVGMWVSLPMEIGDVRKGNISFSKDCFYGYLACGISNYGGTFSLTRID